MRNFTWFKPGDYVTAVNSGNCSFMKGVEGTVCYAETVDSEHALREECNERGNCIHQYTHPQVVMLEGSFAGKPRTRYSGYWFDKVVFERNREFEKGYDDWCEQDTAKALDVVERDFGDFHVS